LTNLTTKEIHKGLEDEIRTLIGSEVMNWTTY